MQKLISSRAFSEGLCQKPVDNSPVGISWSFGFHSCLSLEVGSFNVHSTAHQGTFVSLFAATQHLCTESPGTHYHDCKVPSHIMNTRPCEMGLTAHTLQLGQDETLQSKSSDQDGWSQGSLAITAHVEGATDLPRPWPGRKL